jgi:tripartite-type tricarboxylate transporter receptor subunit TctC
VPTLAEAGGAALAGFDVSTWFGVLAPAGTPTATVERLNAVLRDALGSAEMRERLARMGAEPSATTPAEFAAFIRSELAKYEQVVRFSGARVD